MDFMNGNIIEEKCCFCEYSSPIHETDRYICKKKGVVGYNFKCKKFAFDPFKLSPTLPAKTLQFSPEDFEL